MRGASVVGKESVSHLVRLGEDAVSLKLRGDVLMNALVKQATREKLLALRGGRAGCATPQVGWTPRQNDSNVHQRACQPHTGTQALTASV